MLQCVEVFVVSCSALKYAAVCGSASSVLQCVAAGIAGEISQNPASYEIGYIVNLIAS